MPITKTSKLEIVQKSLNVFKEHGYPKTSVAMLAKVCEIEKAHLYYYFKNKEDIMLEVLNYMKEEARTNISLIINNTALSKRACLEELLAYLVKIYTNQKTGCLMVNTTLQTLYSCDSFIEVVQDFCEYLITTLTFLYQERYSPTYAREKGEQAIQDLYGGVIFAQVYKDNKYLYQAINRIKKKL